MWSKTWSGMLLPETREDPAMPATDETEIGIEKEPESPSDHRRAAALADYRAGELSMREIRRKHGVGAVTLYEWIAAEGLERRPRGPKQTGPRSARTPDGIAGDAVWEVRYWHTVRLPGRSLDEALAKLRRKVGEDVDVRAVQ